MSAFAIEYAAYCRPCSKGFDSDRAFLSHCAAKHASLSAQELNAGRRAKAPCDYCGKPATLLASSASLYEGNDFGPAWFCPCRPAWVGCHPGTTRALGRLADADLRKAKIAAHAAFDQLWRGKMRRDACSKGKARGIGYAWLADQLGIDTAACHIGMFDVATCQRVVEACKPENWRPA
jgi:hypothetical protein